MRINVLLFCLACLLWQTCKAETKKSWSWGNNQKNEKPEEEIKPSEEINLKDTNPRSLSSYDIIPEETEEIVYVKPEQTFNETDMSDQIVDAILTNTRQGRNLEEYDQVYSDPVIQDALQKGDDVQARQLIKERLCNLGLMKCDEVSPDEVIYAQPVAIKPVGEPIASVPVRGPPRAIYHPSKPYRPNGPYGSSKPLASIPPRRGYGPTPQIKPPYSAGFVGASSNLYEGPVPSFSGKPYPNVEIDRPYKFEQYPTKIQISPNGSPSTVAPTTANGVQQHVHHHFHHAGDPSGKLPTVVVNNPIPVIASSPAPLYKPTPAPVNLLTSGHLSGVQGSLSSLFSTNTKPVVEHSGPQTFGSSSSSAPFYSGQNHNGFYGSGSNYGATVGSTGSMAPFYKKELNINNGIYNGNAIQTGFGTGTYANGYQEFESNRVENYDCVCVPIQQCPSQDVIGRKEDLYLNIDPRHLGSDIQAEEDNSTSVNDTNIRIIKETNKNDKVDENDEKKQISKRDVSETLNEEETTKANVEPRVSRALIDDNYMKKVEPTFGVSFGLPHQGGGGYPLNPFGAYPLVNPYGSSIGGSGINLGLVSVNPLISVQVSKDSYGKKVVKPFVNLHVTPNDFLVGKIENLFAYKKHLLFSKHEHLHHHHGYRPYKHHHYAPAYHVKPVIYHKPTIIEGPEFSGPGPIIHSKPSYIDGPTFSRPPPGAIISSDGHYGPPPGAIISSHGPPSHYSDHYDPVPPYSGGFPSSDFFKRNNDNGFAFPGNTYAKRYTDYLQEGNNSDEPNNGLESDYYKTLNKAFTQSASISNPQQELNNNPTDIYSNSRNGKSLGTDDGHSFDQSNTDFSSSASSLNHRETGNKIKFPTSKRRRRRDIDIHIPNDITDESKNSIKRQAYYQRPNQCGPRHVCCRRPSRPVVPIPGRNQQCGTRHAKGINGRIKTPAYIDGDSEFGEYPWQVAILKKDSQESVYVCGGTLIDNLHVLTAAHCVKMYSGFDLRVRLGEWDVNHDVEFYPYIERDVISVHVHPEFYAGTLYNDIAILKLEKPVDWTRSPHISPACLPDRYSDYTGARCWTTGWGKDAFGDFGKYQNILKEVDVPIIGHQQCQQQLQNTRLGYDFKLHPGFICAGGEEGKDACKGDGGGPMVCERGGTWQVVGIVSWGIGCGQYGVPGVYVKVANYLDWIKQITQRY